MSKKFLAALAVAGFVTSAMAAWNFDSSTGTGFVGKGDVQLVYGWNNAQLQSNAGSVQFQAATTSVSETSWVCTNSRNEMTQERERTTTTSTVGVVSKVDRVRNQITGFMLSGYSGTPASTSATEGPKLNSCPAPVSNWTLTSPAGDAVPVGEPTTTLSVSTNGTDWAILQ